MEDQSKSECNTGIYLIMHIATGRPYVGMVAAKYGFEGRWKSHLKSLRNNKHNPILQNAWNKYGEEAFSFVVHTRYVQGDMEYAAFRQFLKIQETRIYNFYPKTFNGNILDNGGNTHLPEVKEKIRNANLIKMKDPNYKLKKIQEINSIEGTIKKIASNKSERIRKMRREQLKIQMQDPELKARRTKQLSSKTSQDKATLGKQKKWQDINWAKKQIELLKATNSTPEVAEKKRISMIAQWQDPIMRAKRIEINKRAAATRKANRLKQLNT